MRTLILAALHRGRFAAQGDRAAKAPSAAEDQLQAVSIGIAEIDAVVVARAAADRDAAPFELGFERLIRATGDIERQMVEVAARRCPAILPEQGDTLMPGVHEYLSVRIPVNRHAENFGVELLGFLRIVDVQHDVVDATGLYHRFLP